MEKSLPNINNKNQLLWTYTCENTEQCFQEFEKNLQKHPDKVKDLGNGGFVALINDMEKIKIYQ